jgi:hypothetical protein
MFSDILDLGSKGPKKSLKDKNFFEIFEMLFNRKVREYFKFSM